MLTNDNIIRSLSANQHQILKWILELYVPRGVFDYDPTYSKGNFYKEGVPEPSVKSDIKKIENGFIADVTDLPFPDNSFDSICFDPPFVMGSGPSVQYPKEGSNIINKRFGIFKNVDELWGFYFLSLLELYRTLKKDGVLIFKCQDCIVSAKQYLSHVEIINKAHQIGFYPKDIFILSANNRILSGKVKKQQHARKFHSYFLVLQKTKSKVQY